MIKTILQMFFRILFRVRLHGDSPEAKQGPLLVVANHESFLDGLLLGLFLPVRATFVVHTTVLHNVWFRLILSQVPHLAVDPTSPLAMKKVIKLLEAGESVVIFPEGRITLTGSLMKVYDGPGFVAAKTGATILPVRLDGAARSYFSRLSGNYPRSLFPRISLTFLATTRIDMPTAPTAKLRRRMAGEAMRRVMQEMLFKSQPVQTLFSALVDAVDIHGRSTRLLEDMKQVEESYGELLTRSLALGRMVEKISAPKETVGVLMPNVSNTVCLIFGMSAVNRVPAMLNYTAGTAGMQNACIAANIRTIITSRQFLEAAKLGETVNAMQGVQLVYLEDLRSTFTLWDKLWLLGFARWFPKAAAHEVHPDESAVVLFTSGSEGKPKGVVHSHRGILANIAQIRAVIDFSPSDKFMIALPLFHAFGFTCGAVMPLVTGSKIFLYPSPLHYRIIPEIIYDRGCTVLFGTSTFLGNYAKFAHPYDFYKLRYVVAGAEKLNEEVRKTWMEKFGIRILEGYGATECAPVLAVNTPMACRNGTVGPLLPGLEPKLEAVPGIETGGLLSVRGPNVMLGYYLFDTPGVLKAPENGWYSTGDIVEIDADGFVSIKGRVKRFAKIAGEMVSLETVEQIAHRASSEYQHAATTQIDPQRGENIVLFTTDTALTRDALSTAARELGSPELAVPRKIVPVKELPLLGTGKTDYVTLKQMAETA
ncbi:acyl-[acyl-carrier-protein]-phospholipid O-acyltransferase / long-chain-fatty-acid--[acyl-carrier-protein] ligase [Novimethylophilus kurashikiensis]|uniref:Acyl-[acyl-carrier-protein]-phospholipid O-acyltransferase / long-chain-fatty-acid--[acyl-carrier-protein] ligase n=1 Tax=Novimethylophilus kurashikiensis TaxID=1825523 RepID=A0A2R5F6A1_9PROT|nr:bifunctional acyl-ACP--phospholipid O-acyltransferase/long-chain-fatty-acid--ACP ligase [Novimethylophilus kurashikiensis]GBG12483.1 acyl-[acyl-carrier-protein]-phospholipid O-acyltransferase / long-chain-fatty-acid--[acyl-carrier-protein] ligase [Novimethylophilus kurashikiensis]